MVEAYYLSYGLPVTTLRPFNTYGPRQLSRAEIPTIISQALTQDSIKLGNLSPTRDFNYVLDTVQGFIKIAEHTESVGMLYNIGSGTEISIGEVVQKVCQLLGLEQVHVIQEIPGTKEGRPKINIMGAQKYGKLKVLLKENTQIVLSPGPIIFELRRLLRDYTSKDYLLLSGDPSVIGIACSVVSDINNGRFNLLKWDRQEQMYYPLEINLHEKGKIDD